MYCNRCGRRLTEGARFCDACGSSIEISAIQPYDPVVKATPPMTQAPVIGERPPDYLAFSIIVTLCCCMPMGVVAIVFSANSRSMLESGNLEGAKEAADKARLFCWLALGLGLVSNLLAFAWGITQGLISGAF